VRELDHLEVRQLAQRLEVVEEVLEAPVRVRAHQPQLAQAREAAQRLQVADRLVRALDALGVDRDRLVAEEDAFGHRPTFW
jgi:hypothetical protein